MSVRSIIRAGLLYQLALPALGAVHEQLAAVPNGWTKVEDADDSTTISLTVALNYQNLDQLESKLISVSTPGHPEYGKHLDLNDINVLFPPASDASVVSWLKDAGISQIHTTGSSVNFATTVGTANKLLNTNFAYYSDGAGQKLRTTQYSIPDHLAGDIDLISPTTYFGKTTAVRSVVSIANTGVKSIDVDASCNKSITPSCLKELYGVGDYVPDPASGSRVAFSSFLNESATYADLNDYEAKFGIPSQSFSVELINGGVNDQNPVTAQNGEANLDVQNIIGVSHPLPVTEYITAGSPPFVPNVDEPTPADNQNEPYLPYYEYLLSKPNSELPQVISNSYGDPEETVPEYYAKRVCNLIGLMGLRGISVLESSGDLGVGAGCQSNDGTKSPRFTPIFPGTCPYITAVGGTQAVAPEVAWVASSGGFSDYFPRPWYQEAAIGTYLSAFIAPETIDYYSKFANFSGRGFPDISAHSLTPDYAIYYNGILSRSGGTSAASPTVAAILALLNDARFRAGKPALGFVNPFLYTIGWVGLNDITLGASDGCNGEDLQTGQPVPGASVIPGAHWNATIGWDPVTGLGTPNFGKLKEIVLAL